MYKIYLTYLSLPFMTVDTIINRPSSFNARSIILISKLLFSWEICNLAYMHAFRKKQREKNKRNTNNIIINFLHYYRATDINRGFLPQGPNYKRGRQRKALKISLS